MTSVKKTDVGVDGESVRSICLLPDLSADSIAQTITILEGITGVRSVRHLPKKTALEVRYSLYQVTFGKLVEALLIEGRYLDESLRTRVRHTWRSYLDTNAQDCLTSTPKASCCCSQPDSAEPKSRT